MSDTTLLALTGRDTLDLLHRISTQALMDLAPGETRTACFCDFRGRLLHRAWVARGGDSTVWMARPDAAAAPLIAFFDRSIFREDVRVSDCSSEAEVVWCSDEAPARGALLEREGFPIRLRAATGPALALIGPRALAAIESTLPALFA